MAGSVSSVNFRAAISGLLLAGCTAVLAGCGVGSEMASSTDSPVTGSLGTISGKAYGGQQPITGARVYVYALGTGGYSTASNSLLKASNGATSDGTNYYVPTDSSGNFSISSAVACPASTQAYLYIVGGNPQTGTGSTNNSAIGLLAPLGACSSSSTVSPPTTYVVTNEVTTAVTAYALAGFASSPTQISYPGTHSLAVTAAKNAMATALNIVNLGTGQVSSATQNAAAQVPAAKLNTVANALASCVNSAGASSPGCSSLFTDTQSATSSDTAAVAINLAKAPFLSKNPNANLFALGTATGAPFTPALGSAPKDWTLGLQYQTAQYSNNLSLGSGDTDYVHNYSLAVDSQGNLWTRGTNEAGNNTTTTFVKYSPLGALLVSPVTVTKASSTYNPFVHVGIDSSDRLWSGVLGGEVVLSTGGSVTTATTTSCATISVPTSTVFGSDGTVYVGDHGSLTTGSTTLYKFNSSGVCQGSLTAPSSGKFSGYLAVQPNGNVASSGFNSNNSNNLIYVYTPGTGFTSTFNAGGDFISTDGSGNIWGFSEIGGTAYDSLHEYFPPNYNSNAQTFYQGGLSQTVGGVGYASYRAGNEGVHVDGAGSVWVGVCPNNCTTANPLSDIIVGLTGTGTGITPDAGLALPFGETGAYALAPDGSGNLWVATKDGALVQYVGLSTPVATPILPGTVGIKP